MTITSHELNAPRKIARRRRVFFTLVFMITGAATWLMADLFWRFDGRLTPLECAMLVLFVILFAQIALGFVTALTGFVISIRGGDRRQIANTIAPGESPQLAGTAVVMPVFNEDVSRVFEGLRVVFRSLQETGRLEHFDFFILSDSNQPNQLVQEEVAWVELCKQVGGFGKIFYRKRRQQINKKAGNVADFLRRWGRKYRYMVVLDADSIMSGDALVKLVAMMEKNPGAGIIQTAPRLVNGETLYARLQQFANRLYSPLFLAGLNFWQQDSGNYWGHNAVIRVQPFIEHCGLPELPGREPFGGRILSHDFVEAALMRKAGWQVWLAGDIEGTYEEGPPTLIDSAKRDRRWCQGNMQHSWLLLAKGFRPVNRLHLLMGVMAYVSSPLWLLFMMLGTVYAFGVANSHGRAMGESFAGALATRGDALVFGMPVQAAEALALFLLTMVMLFASKFMSVFLTLKNRDAAESFGGRKNLVASTLLEVVLSVFLAPVNMLFHSKFVVYTLLGKGVSWVTQKRGGDDGTDWREAIITHAPHIVFGLAWGALAFYIRPVFFWWLSPVLAGMVFSIPISIGLGKLRFGRAAAEAGLFLTPEETRPPYELRRLRLNLEECYKQMRPLDVLRADHGLLQAVLDPYVNAVHVSMLRQKETSSEEAREYFARLRERLLFEGPGGLAQKEKVGLLYDAESMIWLHRELWRRPARDLAEWWRLAVRQYNVLTTTPVTALYR
ncbi:membrane glycosyltransferase [Ereboglobus sp. PH5-10]|uniref:glucans biosynthesis glucosyltransferase MdoH n=1 Tax=Ereboglobus sp. PH5-10 TaxID=2940629 RepID=UPI002407341E|nr:glucans biosynthesis glucosyltransferase MdoH [Ereboglobus sp. PH5-10]MDF9826079.1 membrane glycosyltransferase [Ereboglobus sp. PH5-10]